MTLHEEQLLTPEQLVEWFRERGHVISVNRVREQLAAGVIPGRKIGKCWVTPLPMLRRWIGVTDNLWPETSSLPAPGIVNSPFVMRKAG